MIGVKIMSMGSLLELLIERLKRVGRVSRKVRYGRIYIPPEYIGEYVTYLTQYELGMLLSELDRLRKIKVFTQYILNTKNGTKMFNIISQTWNPVTGCTHYCIYCWARRFALTKLKNTKKYRDGFMPKIHPEEFKKKFNGGVVFVSDMGDLFSTGVPDEWILQVIEHIKKFPNTYFLFLTKNPRRYHDFIDKFPENAILGATIETNKDDLYLNYKPRISNAPLPSERYKAMRDLDWGLKFISIEPILDFDLDMFVAWIKDVDPFMIYVGYDNYGWRLPEPPLDKTMKLIEALSNFTLVIKKTIRPAWFEEKTKKIKTKIKAKKKTLVDYLNT